MHTDLKFHNPAWKTVREVELEDKVYRLERALYRARYGREEYPYEYDLDRPSSTPTITLPRMMSINTIPDERTGKPILGVAARVWTEKPFGVDYYVDPGLLTDTAITAQVLGLQHERFIMQLVHFIKKEKQANAGK